MVHSKKIIIEIVYLLLSVASFYFLFDRTGKYRIFEIIIYCAFLFDFMFRLLKSEKRVRFLIQNPMDIAILIPISGIKILRLFRIIKLLNLNKRAIQRFPKLSYIMQKNRVGLMLLWLFAIMMVISFPLTFIEPQMSDYIDALWWTVVTTTTVGYGDIVPVTIVGKMIGILLMIYGIGIVSIIIANISNMLMRDNDEPVLSMPLSKYDLLDEESKSRIRKRIEEEIELELFKQNKRNKEL